MCNNQQQMLGLLHNEKGCFCVERPSQFQWISDRKGNTRVFYTGYALRHCRYAKFMDPQRPILPQIGVVSVPGSGNTWIRNLLERLTGVVAGSVYVDTHAAQHSIGGLEPWNSGRSTFIKSHSVDIKHSSEKKV